MAVGDWFDQAAIDFYEGLGLDDVEDWIMDADNWEAAFTTITSSIGLLYQGEWEESYALLTNPDAYLGEYLDEQEMK